MNSSLDPTILVIFGITGDLAQRYLLPALYHLIEDGLLGEHTQILGVTRRDMAADTVIDKIESGLGENGNPETIKNMRERVSMFKMDLGNAASYQSLKKHLDEMEERKGMCLNRLYYLSIPPQAYQEVVKGLGEQDLNTSCPHGQAATRLLVEKPFGHDLASALSLIEQTNRYFKEEQVYRIDHYMAKETVQNILTFRFCNPIFEALWNNRHIAQLEIIQKETIGIEGRGTFYDPLGAMRDIIQNHLLQILGIVTMEHPTELTSQAIHANKQAALEQVIAVPSEQIHERAIRGQYNGYKQESGNPDSYTETFAALKVFIDNPRWQGVPVTLLHGKALNERLAEVCVTFHGHGQQKNRLRFRIQPNEGIELELVTKKPGFDYETQTTRMDFSYQGDFGDARHPDAYERVLVDAIRGDRTLFATSEEVLASWRIIQPVVEQWSKNADGLVAYEPDSDGPGLSALKESPGAD